MIHRKPTILSIITYDAIAIDHNDDDDHFKNGQIAASFCNGLVNGWLPLIKMNNLFVACSAPTFSVSVEQIKMLLLIG